MLKRHDPDKWSPNAGSYWTVNVPTELMRRIDLAVIGVPEQTEPSDEEIDALIAQCLAPNGWLDGRKLARALLARYGQPSADTKRLDWLQANPDRIRHALSPSAEWWSITGGRVLPASDLRNAIDAAIAQEAGNA